MDGVFARRRPSFRYQRQPVGDCSPVPLRERMVQDDGRFNGEMDDYTEQRENHGTMILHAVCYSAYTLR